MQKHFCGKCGSELIKNIEYAGDFFGCDELLYDEATGLRVTINTLKCPNYREFLTFSNGHTYKLCK